LAIDKRARLATGCGVQRYGRVLDLEGASRGGGLEGKYTAKEETGKVGLPSVEAERQKRNGKGVKRMKRKKPLDDVERAERTVLWRETVERRVERDADVVHFLSEDRGDVAE